MSHSRVIKLTLMAAVLVTPPAAQAAPAEAWECKVTASSNPAIILQEGRFQVIGNQLFGPSSDAVPLGWRMLIVKNTPDHLLAKNEVGADREWLMIDKHRGQIITYSFGYRRDFGLSLAPPGGKGSGGMNQRLSLTASRLPPRSVSVAPQAPD